MSQCPKCGSKNIKKEVVRGVPRNLCVRCGPLPKSGGPIDR